MKAARFIVIGTCLSALMVVWWMGKNIKRGIIEQVNLADYVPKLAHLKRIRKYPNIAPTWFI